MKKINVDIFEETFKHAPVGIIVTDSLGAILNTNKMHSVITDSVKKEVVGANVRALMASQFL